MSENKFDTMNHEYENTNNTNEAAVQNNSYEDISSYSSDTTAAQPTAAAPAQAYENPVQQPAPSYSNPDYEKYTSQYEMNRVYSQQHTAAKKKSGKGKKIALIAASLALALCMGLGGGIVGTMIASNHNVSTSTSASASGSKTAVATTKGDDSGLTIIKSDNKTSSGSSLESVVANIKDSVVEITTESTSYDSFYGQYISQGAGSGVIISEDGYIVTNNHVIEDANTITVKTTDGKSYNAKLVGTDATLDVALIKIEASGLTVATFGDSDKLNVGETAIAIGNPLGQLGGTVTSGIISALNREIQIDGTTMDLLQTDAAINPGNSGGGLFDADGNLIGIVVAKSSSTSSGTSVEGLGFAIPINNVQSIIGDLKSNGRVTGRASLSVTIVDVNSDAKAAKFNVSEQGVYIYSLSSGGAAEKAGLKVGDLIKKLGDTEISSTATLKTALLKYKAGDKVDITVSRDGSEQVISVTLDEANSDESSNSNNFNANGNSGNNNSDGYGGYEDFYNDFFN